MPDFETRAERNAYFAARGKSESRYERVRGVIADGAEQRKARRDLSNEEKRFVAGETGSARALIDGPAGQDRLEAWGYALRVPLPSDVFDPVTNPAGTRRPFAQVVIENAAYLLQESQKRRIRETQDAQRRASKAVAR